MSWDPSKYISWHF